MDECQLPASETGCHKLAKCNNEMGSYRCIPYVGFILDPATGEIVRKYCSFLLQVAVSDICVRLSIFWVVTSLTCLLSVIMRRAFIVVNHS